MSTGRTAFEQFWSQKLQTSISESRSGDLDRVREAKRRLRNELGYPSRGFVPADAPVGVKQIWKQKEDLADLRALATSEGSAIPPGGSWVDFVSQKANYEENRESLINAGARPPETEREQQRSARADRAEQQAVRSVRDFLMGICDDVEAAGGDGVQALETAAEGRVPEQPGIDGEQVVDSVQDIIDEFGTDTVEQAIRECRIDQESEVEGAPTATDAQGRPIRPVSEIVDEFVSAVNTGGIDDGMDAVTNVELQEVAEAAEKGDLDPADRRAIETAIRGVNDDALGRAADDSDGLFDLLFELGLDIPPPPLEPPSFDETPVIEEKTAEERQAAQRVEDLLEPTAARGLAHYERLVLALRERDPVPNLALSAETLEALTERDRERLLDRAESLRDDIAASNMTLDDFPELQAALTPGPGKSRSNFWRPVLQELRANEEFPTLADRGVPNEELNRLNRADQARQEAIEEVEQQIERLSDSGGGGGQAVPGGGGGGGGGGGISIDDIAEAGADRVADRTVPGRERTDPRTGESWTASREQVELEQDFVSWAHQAKVNNRWDSVDFEYQPENRDMSMERWARLQIKAGNSTVNKAVRAGLPADWFEGLGE